MILYRISRPFVYLFLLMALFFPQQVVAQEEQETREQRSVNILIEGVYDGKVSVIRFIGVKADYENPVDEAFDIKDGETAVLTVPAEYLPGEFVLRLDYRAREADHPYPAERIIFLSDQNISLTVNPPYINNDEKTSFNDGEKENTVYAAFMKENAKKRRPVDVLRQFLLAYDRTEGAVYDEAVKEFDQRRNDYNAWLCAQAAVHQGLFVGRLFQFQHIPACEWKGEENERVRSILKNYFDGIDLSDPLVLRSREMARFMDTYMRMHSLLTDNKEERNALFVQAGQAALKAAAQGHEKVRQWMRDYLYAGYEKEGIADGMAMVNRE